MKMAEKSNHQQQQYENAEEPDQKRQKPDDCENPVNKDETKKITNIYYDCLERIFDFLDLKSLLMVAQTCKRLQIAAAAKFGDEFGKKRIRLYSSEPEPEIIVRQNEIFVYDLKLSLQFLRCFGAKISDLLVRYNFIYSMDGYLDQYINQYCATSLTSIEFRYKSQFSNEAFHKPLKNVQKVEISWIDLRDELKNFVKRFPKVRHLEMLYCSVDETATMNVSFPHLEHLELHIGERSICIENAANLLRANPQLHILKLRLVSELTLTTILDAIIANSLITKLQVVGIFTSLFVDVSKEELKRFVTEHPLVEELDLSCYRLTPVDAIQFIRQMKSLKRIEFRVKDRPACDRITQEFNNEWKSEVSTAWGKFYIKLNR